jgi:glyoxylase-like metal-dependent hydrolase (beta-lactamase superfamily II)
MTGPTRDRAAGRRLPRLGLVALAVVAVAGLAWWARRDFSPRPAAAAVALEPRALALAPGVYLLGKTAPAAAYVVETPEGLVLIDSGLRDDAAAVTSQIAELGLGDRRLRAILLTHVHADHSLGATRLRAQTGARVYAGRADCPPLREGKPRDAFFSVYHMPRLEPHPTPVDVELAGDETLEFGDARFRVLATPGHTPGSVCYLLERGGLRALFTGDVIQSLSPASPGALGTYAAYLPPRYRGSAGDYLASLRRLRALPVPDLVLPGHPRMDPAPQDPRLSERAWAELLDGGIAEMERLLARYEADGADFLDGTPRELLPGLRYLGDYGGRAVYGLLAGGGLFLFDAPGGPGLVEFLKERLRAAGLGEPKVVAVLLTSADPEATAGLAALARATGCKVVAGKAGLEAVRRLCPAGAELLDGEGLQKARWLDVRVLPLGGRGVAPLAYRLRWGGKTVLVSGGIPVKPSVPSAEQVVREVAGPGGSAAEYLRSLDRLAEVTPDLWLPAVPVHGQNANLYDRDWEKVLEQNRTFFSSR